MYSQTFGNAALAATLRASQTQGVRVEARASFLTVSQEEAPASPCHLQVVGCLHLKVSEESWDGLAHSIWNQAKQVKQMKQVKHSVDWLVERTSPTNVSFVSVAK